MSRKLAIGSVLMLAMMLAAGAVSAQEEGEETTAHNGDNAKAAYYIASAFGMAMVSSIAAIAMSISVKSFCEGVSRNPGTAARLQAGLILTLVLIETLALYVLAVIFVKVSL